MDNKQIFTASEARKVFFALLEKVKNNPLQTIVINFRGKPAAVLVNFQEWENIIETLEVASDPELVMNLESIKHDIEQGKILTYDEVFGHAQTGLGVADKGKVVYQVKKAVKRKRL